MWVSQVPLLALANLLVYNTEKKFRARSHNLSEVGEGNQTKYFLGPTYCRWCQNWAQDIFCIWAFLGTEMEKIPLPQISLTFCKTAILSLFYLAISKTDEISLSPGTPPWLNYHRNCPSYNFLDDSILKGNSYLKSLSFKVVSFFAFCLHRVPLVMNDWQDGEGSPCHSLS